MTKSQTANSFNPDAIIDAAINAMITDLWQGTHGPGVFNMNAWVMGPAGLYLGEYWRSEDAGIHIKDGG